MLDLKYYPLNTSIESLTFVADKLASAHIESEATSNKILKGKAKSITHPHRL